MELSFYVVWNIFVTLVIAPLFYSIRKNENESKRIDILVNKTREEMAKEYVTKTDSSYVMNQIVARFDRIEEKIDRLMER